MASHNQTSTYLSNEPATISSLGWARSEGSLSFSVDETLSSEAGDIVKMRLLPQKMDEYGDR